MFLLIHEHSVEHAVELRYKWFTSSPPLVGLTVDPDMLTPSWLHWHPSYYHTSSFKQYSSQIVRYGLPYTIKISAKFTKHFLEN